MYKLGICRSVLVLSVITVLVAFISERALAADKLLYVSGASGNDSGSCIKAAPCQTISYALSRAHAHNKIMVGPGTYAEMVVITQTLDIQGNDSVIDATGLDRGIVIAGSDAAGSRVSGFTVQGATFEGIRAIDTSHVTIENNVVQHNDQGAFSPNPIAECAPQGAVPGDCGEALRLLAVSHSRVANNVVTNNVGGILLTDELGPTFDNQIAFNRVTENVEDCGITLPSHNPMAKMDPSKGGVYGNHIVSNISEKNGGAGVGMFAPFPGAASYNNDVVGNTLIGNGEGGVNIHSHAPDQNVSGNVIVGNIISNNGTDPDSGSPGPNGISFSTIEAQTETVVANRVSNEYVGLFTSGPYTIDGNHSNKFASSVTVPILP
jgi:hypothetical protein